MKESVLLTAMAEINNSLPTVYDDDGNLVRFNLLNCHKFYEMDNFMHLSRTITVEDEQLIELKELALVKNHSGFQVKEPPSPIVCNVEKLVVTDKNDKYNVNYAIGWSGGSYSRPQVFMYSVHKVTI